MINSEIYKKYIVYAHFYDITPNDKAPTKETRRLFADIVEKGYEYASIDAHIVMINPGSCTKRDDAVVNNDYIPEFSVFECRRDPAQRCVMRFMHRAGVHKVRMVNLSDIMEAKSDVIIKKLKDELELEKSLFSPIRQETREKILDMTKPFILSWGTNQGLIKYKKQALETLEGAHCIGLKKNNDEYGYYYIKPYQYENQEEIINKLVKRYTIKKIYFDMDGVLADFNKGVEEFCGIEALDQSNKTPEQDDVMWEAVRKVEHFYDKLPQLEGAKDMYERIAEAYGADRCEILSGIPKPRRGILTAGEDKTSWAHREIDENLKVNIVYREEKKKYAIDSNCILIDDYEKNIKEWEDCGGTGILFTTPENVLRALGLRD